MDHDLYDFAPLPGRRAVSLPGGARLALCPIVHLDHWALDPPEGALADPRFRDRYGDFRPDYRTATWRDYGLRIGIFRVFEVFARHGLTATLAVNARVAERAPGLVGEALARGWEVAGHGAVENQMVTSAMKPAEIAAHVSGCLDILERVSGTRPRGWVAVGRSESAETPQVLAGAGVRWIAHWPNDEQPYRMKTDPPLLSIPVMSELDDTEMLWHRRVATPRYPDLVAEAAEVMAAEGGRVLALGIHAWLMGQPHRIRYLDEAMGRLAAMEGVRAMGCGALADGIGGEDDG